MTKNILIPSENQEKLQKILSECKRSAMGRHSIKFNDKTKEILNEIMDLFYTEVDKSMNIRFKQVRSKHCHCDPDIQIE